MANAPDSKSKELVSQSPVGTVCFPHVWEPHAFQKGQDAKYSLILVFEPKPDLTDMKRAAGRAIIKKWGDKGKILMAQNKLLLPWRDAGEYSKYGPPFKKNNVIINFKSKNPPGIVNGKRQDIIDKMDFYAGCKALVSCYAHAYDTMGNMGVTFFLNNIQKVGDGKRISGQVPANEEFDEIEDDEDMEDMLK